VPLLRHSALTVVYYEGYSMTKNKMIQTFGDMHGNQQSKGVSFPA
jgi:hypothetical protein